jgi:thiol-disulfide isomerase/thioredoxin
VSFLTAFGQPKVGEKAPAIEISEIIDLGVSKDFYKEKFLVLDFWATWCAPCIASFPHLDSVAISMKNNDKVSFALLSYEDGAKLRRFFEKKKAYNINAVKIADVKDTTAKSKYALAGQTFKNFKIWGVPQTYIIDPQGMVRWSGHAMELNKDVIEEVMKGSSVDKVKSAATTVFTPNNVLKVDSIIKNGFIIKASVMSNQGMSSMLNIDKPVNVYYAGHPLPELMATLFDLRQRQIEVKNVQPDKIPFIRLEVNRKEGTTLDSLAKVVGEGFREFYNISYHFENRDFEVYDVVLKDIKKFRKNAAPFDPEDFHNGSGTGNGQSFATNYTYPRLIDLLSTSYKDLIFVMNEKSRRAVKDEKFDYNFPIGNFSRTAVYMNNQYGVELKRKTVSLPVLIIDFKQ